MTEPGWRATLLGAIAAMGWLAGPVPLPPHYHPIGPTTDGQISSGGD